MHSFPPHPKEGTLLICINFYLNFYTGGKKSDKTETPDSDESSSDSDEEEEQEPEGAVGGEDPEETGPDTDSDQDSPGMLKLRQ